MKVAITGATGLLGGNLAIELLKAGHEVVASRRATSKVDHLESFDIQWVQAELNDPAALTACFEGCEAVFHCAAAVSIQFETTPWIIEANVDGTRHIIEAVKAAGVRRLVHCSTVGAVGLSETGEPSDETATWNMPDYGLGDAYVTTKRQAQDIVLEAAAQGLDVVIVNPTFMIGPYDSKPSSGRLVRDLVRGKVPGYTAGMNNFVDVRDVARGMILALDKGRAGELYILGGVNMSYKTFMDLVSETVDAPVVKRNIPKWAGRFFGWLGDLQGKITGKDPLLTSATIRWSETERFIFTSGKAIRELGYTISPLEPAIQDAVDWFRLREML
jgi:dihydroflavonol-4-reductase